MKTLIYAAAALSLSGSALAYQTATSQMDAATQTASDSATGTMTAMAPVDVSATLTPPATWTEEQRTLWQEHQSTYPTDWSSADRAAFQSMMGTPPANWSAEQRGLYEQHIAHLPSNWTPAQRTAYEQQIAEFRTPWIAGSQTASTGSPDFQTFSGMGGPYEEVYGSGTVNLTPRPAQANYPPCDPGPGDDNCIQLYERGVRAQLASWNESTGGLADSGSATAMGGPFEPVNDHGARTHSDISMTDPSASGETGIGPDWSNSTDPVDPLGTTQDDTVEPTL